MSKRLQVVMDEAELAETEEVARQMGLTVSEWVRGVLRAARREEPRAAVDKRLSAVRAAAQHAFPTADIDEMLREIEGGYGSALPE